jgi:aspartate racemase
MTDILKIGLASGINGVVAPYIKAALFRAAAEHKRTVDLLEDGTELRRDAADETTKLRDMKIASLDAARNLQRRGADAVLLSNIASEAFRTEVQAELSVPVFSLYTGAFDAVRASGKKKVGMLGFAVPADFIRASLPGFEIIEGSGTEDARTDDPEAASRECELLLGKGAEILLPCCGREAGAAPELIRRGYPVVDVFSLACDALMADPPKRVPRGFKIGMIGGLGPAATVDLYDKVTRATPAKTDQEHIKVVIEQNPQIADRTAALLEGGPDPTLALYACAKRLEEDECDAIIVPCNTAHAFLPYLERHIRIPFVNMQQAALEEIQAKLGSKARIGLLATTGTVRTGIYSKKAEAMGLPMFVPDDEHQKRVMAAIYGPRGAKAGFTDGVCRDDLMSGAEYLVKTYGCNCLILGCTELPLILDESDAFPVAGQNVTVVDPTSALARKIVRMALKADEERGGIR